METVLNNGRATKRGFCPPPLVTPPSGDNDMDILSVVIVGTQPIYFQSYWIKFVHNTIKFLWGPGFIGKSTRLKLNSITQETSKQAKLEIFQNWNLEAYEQSTIMIIMTLLEQDYHNTQQDSFVSLLHVSSYKKAWKISAVSVDQEISATKKLIITSVYLIVVVVVCLLFVVVVIVY